MYPQLQVGQSRMSAVDQKLAEKPKQTQINDYLSQHNSESQVNLSYINPPILSKTFNYVKYMSTVKFKLPY